MNIEIFTASGGLAAGFRDAGIAFAFAVDHDGDACDSYEANLGVRPVQTDVHELLGRVRAGWRPAAVLDLLVADPPCTPWSRAGKRKGLDDERDMLVETAELIALLRPRAYLIGNIPGLQDAPSWPVVQRVIGGLSRYGYCVADFAVLDAANYGVPQRRERPFWFGHIDGPCIRWPAPTHGTNLGGGLPGLTLRPWVTCREALQHLPLEELGRPVHMKLRPAKQAQHSGDLKYGSDISRCSTPDAVASTLTTKDTAKGGQILIAESRDRHPPAQLDAPARTIKADGGRAGRRESVLSIPEGHRANRPDEPSQTMGAKVRNVGPQVLAFTQHDLPQSARPSSPDRPSHTINTKEPRAGEGNALLAWPWETPATTLTADPNGRIAPPGRRPYESMGSTLSGPNAVVLSERAAAILQGFPEGWKFCGKTKRARWSQLGQAVPPPVAKAIGLAVLEQRRRATGGA